MITPGSDFKVLGLERYLSNWWLYCSYSVQRFLKNLLLVTIK